jgi:hypothetical protein
MWTPADWEAEPEDDLKVAQRMIGDDVTGPPTHGGMTEDEGWRDDEERRRNY